LRARQRSVDRGDPACPLEFVARRRGGLLRRARAPSPRPPAPRSQPPRGGKTPAPRSAHPEAEALFELPLMAPLGTVRKSSRSRRPRQAEARLLLRRGAPPVRRG